jgi:hypothetical protein
LSDTPSSDHSELITREKARKKRLREFLKQRERTLENPPDPTIVPSRPRQKRRPRPAAADHAGTGIRPASEIRHGPSILPLSIEVPVCSLVFHSSQFPDPNAMDELDKHLQIDALPQIDVSEAFSRSYEFHGDIDQGIVRVTRGDFSYDFACTLGDDWKFQQIASIASGLSGHGPTGWQSKSIPEILRAAAVDLTLAVRAVHGSLPRGAWADFWSSRQVQDHLARLFDELLQKSNTLALKSADTAAEVELALFIHEALWRFANQLSLGEVCCRITPPRYDQERGTSRLQSVVPPAIGMTSLLASRDEASPAADQPAEISQADSTSRNKGGRPKVFVDSGMRFRTPKSTGGQARGRFAKSHSEPESSQAI